MSTGFDGDVLASASPIASGVVLAGKYRLVRPAGFGGMAEVWIAENQATRAEVCVKLLVAPIDDTDAVVRFEREARAAAGLSHRAIVRVYDFFDVTADLAATPGEPPSRKLAIVMDLLQGETLADRLDREGKLGLEAALDLLLPITSGLSYAHKKGVVHRDIKPENIFLAKDPDGAITPKILDFGVSKLTRSDASSITRDGELLGTPSFMSPEQVRASKDVDERSDVFSLGLLFYVALTGVNPFERERSVVAAILELELPRIEELADDVWAILERALAKDRAERFRDATELGIALRRAAGRSIETDPGARSSASLRLSPPREPLASDVSVPPPVTEDTNIGLSPLRSAQNRRRSIVLAVVAAASVISLLALVRGLLSDGGSSTARPATSVLGAPLQAPSASVTGSVSAPPAPVPSPPAVIELAEAGAAPAASDPVDSGAVEIAPAPRPRAPRPEPPPPPPPAPSPRATSSGMVDAPTKPSGGPSPVATDPGF